MKQSKTRKILSGGLLIIGVVGILAVLSGIVLLNAERWWGNKADVSLSDMSTSDNSLPPATVSLNQASAEIGKGLSFQLIADGGDSIVFHSSDESVACVDENGLITGTGVGECTVTAENEHHNAAECAVTVKKTCYITIDDGPSDSTEEILQVLKDNDVPATFFVVSSPKLYLTKNMREQGCVVGLHTYSHVFKKCYATQNSYLSGIEKMSKIVEGYTGEHCSLLRFPGGTSNKRCNDLWMRRSLNGAMDLGYRVFDWTATTGDSSKRASADFSVQNVKKTCTEDVEILLMHDRQLNVDALKKFIPYLREEGYVFATLDQYPEHSFYFKPRYNRGRADVPSRSVIITHESFSLDVGEGIGLVARMEPTKSTDYVKWESADPSIAEVSVSGYVRAVNPGETDIYATTTSGHRGVCHMTVLAP